MLHYFSCEAAFSNGYKKAKEGSKLSGEDIKKEFNGTRSRECPFCESEPQRVYAGKVQTMTDWGEKCRQHIDFCCVAYNKGREKALNETSRPVTFTPGPSPSPTPPTSTFTHYSDSTTGPFGIPQNYPFQYCPTDTLAGPFGFSMNSFRSK